MFPLHTKLHKFHTSKELIQIQIPLNIINLSTLKCSFFDRV